MSLDFVAILKKILKVLIEYHKTYLYHLKILIEYDETFKILI